MAANAAQIGDSIWGVFGLVVLAWTGAFSEDLVFRCHFFTNLRNLGDPAALAPLHKLLESEPARIVVEHAERARLEGTG